jgi:hypothetical protein
MFHDFFEKGTFDRILFSQTFCQMMKIHPKKNTAAKDAIWLGNAKVR